MMRYTKRKSLHIISKEQIIDDLNGFMSPLQRKMMKELLEHVDELNVHIEHLNDDINNHDRHRHDPFSYG